MLGDGSPIEFDVSSTGDNYVDFANTLLYVKTKVTQLNGTDPRRCGGGSSESVSAQSVLAGGHYFAERCPDNLLDQHLSLSGHADDAVELWS